MTEQGEQRWSATLPWERIYWAAMNREVPKGMGEEVWKTLMSHTTGWMAEKYYNAGPAWRSGFLWLISAVCRPPEQASIMINAIILSRPELFNEALVKGMEEAKEALEDRVDSLEYDMSELELERDRLVQENEELEQKLADALAQANDLKAEIVDWQAMAGAAKEKLATERKAKQDMEDRCWARIKTLLERAKQDEIDAKAYRALRDALLIMLAS